MQNFVGTIVVTDGSVSVIIVTISSSGKEPPMSTRTETLLMAATIGLMTVAMIYFIINQEYYNIVLLLDAWMRAAPNFLKKDGQ